MSIGFVSVLLLIGRKTRFLQLFRASRAELKKDFENSCIVSQPEVTQLNHF